MTKLSEKTVKNLNRNKEICILRENGMTYRAIGKKYNLSGMAIWIICEKERRRKLSG
jgi:Mor family transcriptional regulator